MKEDNASKKVRQDSMPAVKVSELCEMIQHGSIEMDMPGVVVLVNQDLSMGRVETAGLPEKHKLNVIFPMMMSGLSQIAKSAVEYKPEALGTIARWWGHKCQDDGVRGVLRGILKDM